MRRSVLACRQVERSVIPSYAGMACVSLVRASMPPMGHHNSTDCANGAPDSVTDAATEAVIPPVIRVTVSIDTQRPPTCTCLTPLLDREPRVQFFVPGTCYIQI